MEFSKYQGTGNDFILIDNRKGQLKPLTPKQVATWCDRRFGIGADGLILLNSHPEYDFAMKNYNADGGESSMCGNGARALIQFAADLGIVKKNYHFLAVDGPHEATLDVDPSGENLISVKMQDVDEIKNSPFGCVLNTGSPHLICILPKGSKHKPDVPAEGKQLRNDPHFAPSGVNVNFIERIGDDKITIRTYERGVENETLSCGTGVIASALVLSNTEEHYLPPGEHQMALHARGGLLQVKFDKKSSSTFKNIWLIGPAKKTFQGTLNDR